MTPSLHQPALVFDAGVGSFDLARRIHHRYPGQDVIYLADRASFPYGAKSRHALHDCIRDVIAYFVETYHIAAAVLASNTPSVMVLENLRHEFNALPLLGVTPPVDDALAQSRTGEIGILGTRGMVNSPEMRAFLAPYQGAKIRLIDASPMIDTLIETGVFITDAGRTERVIREVLDPVFRAFPQLDTLTLSSTHLPWLNMAEPCPYLSLLYPHVRWIDPAEATTEALAALLPPVKGTGAFCCFATEQEGLPAQGLEDMLAQMGAPVSVTAIRIPKR